MSSLLFLTNTVNYLISKGISSQDIVLFLMLPMIATIICFFRQIFGIKTLGIYVPSILTLIFLVLGIKNSLTLFLAILAIAILIELILKKARLMYLCRVALILTVVILAVLLLFVLGVYLQKDSLTFLSIFPVLILVLLVERFIAVQVERGEKQALILSLETVAVSCFCFWIANLEGLKNIILKYPEIILLTLPINILLGKWTGLRLTEYFRFQEVRRLVKEKR